MLGVKENIQQGTGLELPCSRDADEPYPLSPLSLRRGKLLKTFYMNLAGGTVWAGAFRERSSLFQNMRLETIVEAELPYFLHTIRGGHLFSSCAPFPFPLELLERFGPPGEITILSTGSILATLRLAWSDRSGMEGLLRRDSEFSAALIAWMENHDLGVSASASRGIV